MAASTDRYTSRVANIVLKKVWKLREVLNVRVTTGHRLAQAQEEPAGWRRLPRFCLEFTKIFYNIESKFLNSKVLAGGFVMRCAKKSWF